MGASKRKIDHEKLLRRTICASLCFFLGVSHAFSVEQYTAEARRMATAVVHQTTATWCVAKSDASDSDLQAALDWTCGQETDQGNVDCSAINSDGQCYDPDTLGAHASYAFNAYFQKTNQAPEACNFNNCAQTTNTDPSSGTCSYTSSSLLSNNVSTSSPGFTSSSDDFPRPNALLLLASVCGTLAVRVKL